MSRKSQKTIYKMKIIAIIENVGKPTIKPKEIYIMDALTFFGHCIYFLIGAFIGTSVMYFGGLIIDRRSDNDR